MLKSLLIAALPKSVSRGIDDRRWIASVRETHSRLNPPEARAYAAAHARARAAYAARSGGKTPYPAQSEEYAAKDYTSLRTPASTALLSALGERVKAAHARGDKVFGPDAAPLLGAECYAAFPEVDALLRGDLGDFLRAIFRSEFKVSHAHFGRKRGGVEMRKIWHSDSGPGTCLNVFCYMSDATPDYAPTTLLPWAPSAEIFAEEKAYMRDLAARAPGRLAEKSARQDALDEFYGRRIRERFPGIVEMPGGGAGTMVAFNNNVLHWAGLPEPGRQRLTLNMRVYPCVEPPDFERYARDGFARKLPYLSPDSPP